MQDRAQDDAGITEPVRMLGEISALVSRLADTDAQEVLLEVLRATRRAARMPRGVAFLFDYTANDLHIIAGDGSARRVPMQSQVSEGASPDLPSEGSPPGGHVYAQLGPGEPSVVLPLTTGPRQLGEMGLLCAGEKITLDHDQRDLLAALAHLAGIAIDRCMRRRDLLRLREWHDAFSTVLAASRTPSSATEVDLVLQEIAANALNIALADFVVLYEYLEERHDVRLPAVIAGELRDAHVLRSRGVAVEHRRSAIFRLLDRNEPFYAEDAPSDWLDAGLIDSGAGESSLFAREGVVSSIGIPLRIEKERVGALFINYRHEQSFSFDLRSNLELFASQAAMAIGNAQFYLRSQRYSQDLEAINRVGRDLASAVSRDIDEIGALIDHHTSQVIPARNFFLCIYDGDRNQFQLPYIRDEFDTRETLESALHAGLTGYVCRTGKPFFGTPETKRRLFAEGNARLVGHPATIWLGAPLIVRDEIVGALVVQNYGEESTLDEGHLQLLAAIASQVAGAIDSYRLLAEARLRLQELSALLELSQAFGERRLSSTQLLSSILDHLCLLAACDGSLLFLVDLAHQRRLKVAAASARLADYVGRTIAIDEGLVGSVARTLSPQVINDYAKSPDHYQVFDPPPRSVCAVPLVWKGEFIGVIILSSGAAAGKFSRREVEILQRFAGPAAIAVENTRDSSLRRALVQAGPNAIVAADTAGRIIELNQGAARLFKCSQIDLIGESVTRLYWEGLPGARKIRQLLARDAKVTEEEVFGIDCNGDKIPLTISAALLKDDAGRVIGSVGILEDLRLQSLRGRTRLLVDALREISDAEQLNLICKVVVDSAVTLLYADAGCLFLRTGKSFSAESAYPDDSELARAQLTEGVRVRLTELARADPREILLFPEHGKIGVPGMHPDAVSAVLVPIRTERRLLGFLLVESRQRSHFSADQELLTVLASQAAVSLNRVELLTAEHNLLLSSNAIMAGQLAAAFLHEAKNALNVSNIILQDLREGIERESELRKKKAYLRQLAEVQAEVARIGDLSRRMQQFSQQDLRPEMRQVYVNELVTKTLHLLAAALRAKSIMSDLRLDPGLDRPTKGVGNPVVADERQLQQVLMNLIINAVAASPVRRPLLVETRNLQERIEIRITDHGSGIAPKDRPHLFTPFFTTKEGGVGLGLFLSRILIEDNHRGSIEIVSSAPGKGTTFSVMMRKQGQKGGGPA